MKIYFKIVQNLHLKIMKQSLHIVYASPMWNMLSACPAADIENVRIWNQNRITKKGWVEGILSDMHATELIGYK